jgi:hypothetical protein
MVTVGPWPMGHGPVVPMGPGLQGWAHGAGLGTRVHCCGGQTSAKTGPGQVMCSVLKSGAIYDRVRLLLFACNLLKIHKYTQCIHWKIAKCQKYEI